MTQGYSIISNMTCGNRASFYIDTGSTWKRYTYSRWNRDTNAWLNMDTGSTWQLDIVAFQTEPWLY